MTSRPARVDMRARNPCLRARFRRLGWNVRFMTVFLCCLSFAQPRLLMAPGKQAARIVYEWLTKEDNFNFCGAP
jgi:hypothetical protein